MKEEWVEMGEKDDIRDIWSKGRKSMKDRKEGEI